MTNDEKVEEVFEYLANTIQTFHPIQDLGVLKMLCSFYLLAHIEKESGDEKRAEMLCVIPHDYLCRGGRYHEALADLEVKMFKWLEINYGPTTFKEDLH